MSHEGLACGLDTILLRISFRMFNNNGRGSIGSMQLTGSLSVISLSLGECG